MAIKISNTTVIDNSRNITNAGGGTFSGTVTANAFVGDGSGLTNAGMPPGTKMLFVQASAPTGWTKDTTSTFDNSALRIVTGTGGGSTGGTQAFSSKFNSTYNTDEHVLTTAQMPQHLHRYELARFQTNHPGTGYNFQMVTAPATVSGAYLNAPGNTANTGSDEGHSHGLTMDVKYVDTIICSKN